MRRVYYHFRGCAVTAWVTSGCGAVVTWLVYATDWRDVCEQLLEWVPKTIFGAQIDMNWLRRNSGGFNEDSTEVQREHHARAYILMITGGSPNAR
ncbi:serine/threonine-protein phosphatase 7 long form-like protein [Gossypium australe]|uniref:Serine/threonine-protein phosphatase 7 long form-like protein n=1 Tax=Gossypium australe TaxID=47621 RepID=A0A5B6VL81_9ROSI|nr:serine/threonine-protein phosphatase 7 long form-like protein [Gossypium australe]